ncbi:uncharacterized protein LOC128554628 [Mercenaria mercenaria]|uniref:uncharacterized protein LOC128554628 n=1 Tax=Mercenaria mercenaria TaxID=6596 RepID=UPI00234E4D6A|nr:uncharacterized protein LOC128554628 [Mercenaria mercenaria]
MFFKVQLTVLSAQTQHTKVLDLMKKFTMAAAKILNTMKPLIDAGAKFQSVAVIKETFSHIMKITEEMKTETKTTQLRYMEIQHEIQKQIAKRNEELAREKKEMEKQLAKLDKENREKDEVLIDPKSKRNIWTTQAARLAHIRDRGAVVGAGTIAALPFGFTAGGMAAGGMALGGVFPAGGITSLFGLFQTGVTDRYLSTAAEQVISEKQDEIRQLHEQRKKVLKQLSTLKKLKMKTESLREAHAQLGNVDKHFTRSIEFWSNMAAALKALRDESTPGSVFVSQIVNPKLAKKFTISIGRAQKDFKFIEDICSDYVQKSVKEIFTLYKFLLVPIDSVAFAQHGYP